MALCPAETVSAGEHILYCIHQRHINKTKIHPSDGTEADEKAFRAADFLIILKDLDRNIQCSGKSVNLDK